MGHKYKKENYFKSLYRSIVVLWSVIQGGYGYRLEEGDGHLFRVLYHIDLLLNVLTGGNPQVTVSGRVGYYNLKQFKYKFKPLKWYWSLMRRIIDSTFEPVDGEQHCFNAYEMHIKEFKEDYGGREACKIIFDKGSVVFLSLLLILTSIACLFIYPLTHGYTKKIKKKFW